LNALNRRKRLASKGFEMNAQEISEILDQIIKYAEILAAYKSDLNAGILSAMRYDAVRGGKVSAKFRTSAIEKKVEKMALLEEIVQDLRDALDAVRVVQNT
jgi:hypothetical protein